MGAGDAAHASAGVLVGGAARILDRGLDRLGVGAEGELDEQLRLVVAAARLDKAARRRTAARAEDPLEVDDGGDGVGIEGRPPGARRGRHPGVAEVVLEQRAVPSSVFTGAVAERSRPKRRPSREYAALCSGA